MSATPSERLVAAREHLSLAFLAIEAAGSSLPEPERGAACEVRADIGEALRRLNSLLVFAGKDTR